uniref:Ig-like domain-containing protein n=1 Tax=Dromaius novaehollandiae TaxID=8790 RepID=A0A8C4P8Q0_DRONO
MGICIAMSTPCLSGSISLTAGDPSITIYLQPPGVIPLGGSATICCECQYNGGSFVLYRNGQQFRTLKPRGSRAEFSISNATRSFSGPYSCHYLCHKAPSTTSLPTELQGPKPVLSILPGHEVTAGSDVLLQCIFQDTNAICFLYLEGQAGTLHSFPEKDAKFHLSQVKQGNGGRYSCQCYIKGTPPKWSSTSDPSISGWWWQVRAGSMCLASSVASAPGHTRKGDRLKTGGGVTVGQGAGTGETEAVRSPWGSPLLPINFPVSPFSPGDPQGVPLFTWVYTSDCPFLYPADYTWGNTLRLALGAAILVLLGLIVAEALHSHRPTPGHPGPL